MYGSAHANRIATRRNELQTFLVDTTHAQGHSTFTQQVMQMLLVQANSYNFRASVQKYYGETGKVGRSVHYTAILVFFQ